jgi:uncharacterized protein (DUF433 family)
MSETTSNNSLVVETSRGPSIAGTRITVYSVMDLIKNNRSKEYIAQMMLITPEEVDAVYEYIARHRNAVEQEYERILLREAEARAEAEKFMRERTPDLFDISPEELRRRLIQKLEEKKKAIQAQNGNHEYRGARRVWAP